MDLARAAAVLAQLGAEPRLRVFRLLVQHADEGLTIGQIQSRTGIPASTLAFHLKGLAQVDLVRQEKAGRSVICRPNVELVDQAAQFLLSDCCAGSRAVA